MDVVALMTDTMGFTPEDAASPIAKLAAVDLTAGERAALDRLLDLATDGAALDVVGFAADPFARMGSLIGAGFKVEIEGIKVGQLSTPTKSIIMTEENHEI